MKYVFILLVMCMLASCFRKPAPLEIQTCTDSCFVITGRLTDGLRPLPWEEVRLHYRETNFFYSMYSNIAATTTNEDGVFRFSFSAKKYKNAPGGYYITGGKDGYFSNPSDGGDTILMTSINLEEKDIDSPNFYDIYLFKTAKLQFRIEDSATYSFYVSYSINGNYHSSQIPKGASLSAPSKAAADLPTVITWNRKNDSGKTVIILDTIVLKHGEERVYDVKL
jgi:hypothetical protein